MDLSQFKASDNCKGHEQLLHYTNVDTLKIMLSNRMLKFNSLKNVNDLLEKKRNGIEALLDTIYVSCFCHYKYEIVPFWFIYGGGVPNSEKVLLRFKNFAKDFNNVFENDWAFTGENKIILFNPKGLFAFNSGGVSCCPIDNPLLEKRQTIETVRMFDIQYLLPDDETFSKEYTTEGSVSFGEGQSTLPVAISDMRSAGKQKTIHWQYEAETRIQCSVNPPSECYFDYILLHIKDEVFRDLVIVVNPWATSDFMACIDTTLRESTLPIGIKNSIKIKRSELDGQIVEKGC